MAIKLQTEMGTGVTGEYFSIREIILTDTKMKIKYDLHISEQMKINGFTAIQSLMMIKDHVKSETVSGNIYAIAYGLLKESNMAYGEELNRLVNAVDVL